MSLGRHPFLDHVDRHRIGPVVGAEAIPALAPETWTAVHRQALQARIRDNAIGALGAVAELRRLVRLLEMANVPFAVLKGLPLAVQYYGSIAGRHVGDIDILIRQDDVMVVAERLSASGYLSSQSLHEMEARALQRYLRHYHHCEYQCQQSGITVEIHWRLMRNPYLFVLPELLATPSVLRQCSLPGMVVPVLAPAELLLYLCCHGTEHLWFRLKWAFDLPRVLDSQSWDWDGLFRRAGELNCKPSLALGLHVAADLGGWMMPVTVRRLLAAHGAMRLERSAVRLAVKGVECHAGGTPVSVWQRVRQFIFHWRIARTARARAWELSRYGTSWQDWQTLPLPDWLFWLYFPLRPLLVLWRRAAGIARARADG